MQGVIDGVPIILVLLVGIGAPLAGWYASRRTRNPAVWFALGALTGPVALLLLAAAPPGRCPECDEPVDGWAADCDRCGEPLSARVASRPAPSPQSSAPEQMTGTPSTTAAVAPEAPFRPARPVALPTPISTARGSATRRDARQGWPDRPMASPMSLGVRPTFMPSNYVAATGGDPPEGEVLSTGVYLSGNVGLEVGACYAIARDGDKLRVADRSPRWARGRRRRHRHGRSRDHHGS